MGKFRRKPTGFHNCNNKNSLRFDNFIQQSSFKQIGKLVGVVFILFFLAVSVWILIDACNGSSIQEPKKEARVAQRLTNDISAASNPKAEKVADTTVISSTTSEAINYVIRIQSGQNASENTEDLSTKNTQTTETDTVKGSAVNINLIQVVEEDYEPSWYEKPYDLFVQSINPSLSRDVRSFWKEVIIFILFLIISFGLSGLIFTILINMFERRKEKWENGDINYDITKEFILIIGGHKMVNQLCEDLLLSKQLRMNENIVLVIQTRRKAIMLRKELEAKIGPDLVKRVFIYNGDRTSEDNLKVLNPQFAQQIYIIGEESFFDGNSHDAFSLQCLKILNEMIEKDMKEKGQVAVIRINPQENKDKNEVLIIPCHVMFEYQSSTKIFQYTDRALCSRLEFIPFNYYEKWAAQALVFDTDIKPIPPKDPEGKINGPNNDANTAGEISSNAPNPTKENIEKTEVSETEVEVKSSEEVIEKAKVEGKEEKENKTVISINPKIKYPFILGDKPELFRDTNKRVHIIIIGMSKMGTMFGAMAAHVCHFPNFFKCQEHPRTLITFIDPNGKVEMNFFKGRNPSLCELSRWRYVNAEDYMNEDQVPQGSIYQKEFKGIDPMNRKGAESIFLENNIDPGLMDIDWEFIKGDMGTPSIQKYLQDAANDDGCVTTIAVCIPVAYEAVSTSLFMPEEVYQSDKVTQILVLQHASDAVVLTASQEIETEFVHRDTRKHLCVNPYKKLRPFGMFDQCSYVNHLDILPMIINYIYGFGDDKEELKNIKDTEKWQEAFNNLGEELCRDLAETLKRNAPVGIIEEAAYKFILMTTQNGKSVQAMRASNFYNSYSILYKAQVFQIAPSTKPLDRKTQESTIIEIAHTEHNRWDMEQIFVGYRPTKKDDQLKYSALVDQEVKYGIYKTKPDGQEEFKEINKAKDLKLRRIHPDIHSYDATDVDGGLDDWTKFYDIKIAIMTPVLYKCYLMLLGKELRD